ARALVARSASLAPPGVEGRDHDCIWRVVDDDVHAGGRLECADVPSLAADDAAFHLVGWESDRGDRGFGGGLRREPLDGEGEDFLRFLVRALARLLLQVARERGGLVA